MCNFTAVRQIFRLFSAMLTIMWRVIISSYHLLVKLPDDKCNDFFCFYYENCLSGSLFLLSTRFLTTISSVSCTRTHDSSRRDLLEFGTLVCNSVKLCSR